MKLPDDLTRPHCVPLIHDQSQSSQQLDLQPVLLTVLGIALARYCVVASYFRAMRRQVQANGCRHRSKIFSLGLLAALLLSMVACATQPGLHPQAVTLPPDLLTSEPVPVIPPPSPPQVNEQMSDDTRTCTFAMQGTVADLQLVLDDQAIQFTADPEILKRHLTLHVEDMRVSEVLEIVRHEISGESELVYRQGCYRLGKPIYSDLLVRSFKVPVEDMKTVTEAVKTVGSPSVSSTLVGDVLVVRDTDKGMAAIEKVMKSISKVRKQWVVEVRYVEMTKTGAEKIGIDWQTAGTAALNLTTAHAGSVTALAKLDLNGILNASASGGDVQVLNFSRLHVVEGDTATLQVGSTTPVPQTTVSETGTVTTTGYTNIDTGVLLTIVCRALPDGLIRLYANPEISDVTSYVEAAPVVSKRKITSSAILASGGVVVLGGLTAWHGTNNATGLPFVGDYPFGGIFDRRRSDSRLFVVMQITEIPSITR